MNSNGFALAIGPVCLTDALFGILFFDA